MSLHTSPAQPDHDIDHQVAEARKQRIKALFLRYPDIDSDEQKELLTYLKSGPLLEIGLLKGDESIRYRIAAFEQAQERALNRSPMDIVVLIAILVVATAVCSALWDIGV